MGLLCLVFFFFQAEDGIRDGRVTGVQTCALPISEDGDGVWPRLVGARAIRRLPRVWRWGQVALPPDRATVAQCGAVQDRSEERRVGKECRSRWSPEH